MEVVHKALDYVEPLWALVSPYVPALKLDTLDAGLLCMLLALLWYAVNAVRTAVKDLSDDDDDAEVSAPAAAAPVVFLFRVDTRRAAIAHGSLSE